MEVLKLIVTIILLIPFLIVGFYLLVFVLGLGAATAQSAKDTVDLLKKPEINERGEPMVNRDELLTRVGAFLVLAGLFSAFIYAVFFSN